LSLAALFVVLGGGIGFQVVRLEHLIAVEAALVVHAFAARNDLPSFVCAGGRHRGEITLIVFKPLRVSSTSLSLRYRAASAHSSGAFHPAGAAIVRCTPSCG